MNCTECRDTLLAQIEGCLDPETSFQCERHLGCCVDCQAEFDAMIRLQERLVDRGRPSIHLSITESVMRQIQTAPPLIQKEPIMKRIISGWGFQLCAATCAAAILTMILVFFPGNQARALEVLAKGSRAVAQLRTIHLRCKLRTLPADNFAFIAPDQDFSSVEVWKQFGAEPKWRIEKPGRVAVMDGQSSVLYFKTSNAAVKDGPSASAFDTDWLHQIADLSNALNRELTNARAKGWKLKLAKEAGKDGRTKSVVTVLAKSGLPDDDYLRNKFIDLSDTRRVYRFDAQTGLLENAQIYLSKPFGDVLIFEISQIECNQDINAGVFHLALPENVAYQREPRVQSRDAACIAMTAEEIARAFFEAMGRNDWDEAAHLSDGMPLGDAAKKSFGGLKVLSIGRSFTSRGYPGWFVPYEIQLKNGEVIRHNLALKRKGSTQMWFVDGGY